MITCVRRIIVIFKESKILLLNNMKLHDRGKYKHEEEH